MMPGGIDPHTHLAMPFMGQVTCDDFFRCGQCDLQYRVADGALACWRAVVEGCPWLG